MSNDSVDKLVIFLAKRDGIDKLVKTFQYLSKLFHWHTESTRPGLAQRAKQWEVASGLSRKAFRTGRFLTGFNAVRRNPGSTPTFRFLSVLSNAGEMVYFFFDHFLWVSRVGVLDPHLARKMSFISAFGEAFGYIFFIISDFILIREGIEAEREIVGSTEKSTEGDDKIGKIRGERIMRLMAVAANLADLVIAVADIEPNPFCNHAVTLGISGLVSAWAGCFIASAMNVDSLYLKGLCFLKMNPGPLAFLVALKIPRVVLNSGWTGLLCPCVLFGRNVQRIRDDANCIGPCMCHAIVIEGGIALAAATAAFYGFDPSTSLLICEGLLFSWGICGLYTGLFRQWLQRKYHLKSSPCGPCLVHCCMHSCALCQEHREMNGRLSDGVVPRTIVNPPPVQEINTANDSSGTSAPSAQIVDHASLEMQAP
ncbi:hypothetical protein RHSIM_Rhsim03G0167100 [Rhododendron simsii]|uniref:Uncharacterized protein n=1 Tax=Rhododendron simsii TaxID=118357 RepID=A0A834LQQ2_RHOSS|nr:hypothetical protein RHSIM_Rhsim03G0167100 [Rhododendron simsii]